jgi:hypothetical protein
MTKSTSKGQQRNGHTKTGTAAAVSSASTHATVKGSNKSDKKGKGDEIKDKTTSSPLSTTNGKIKNRPSPSVKSGTANEVKLLKKLCQVIKFIFKSKVKHNIVLHDDYHCDSTTGHIKEDS